MEKSVSLDWEAVRPYMIAQESSARAAVNKLNIIIKTVDGINSTPGGADPAVTTVISTMETTLKILSDCPDYVSEISESLKRKSEEIQDSVGEFNSQMENL